MRLYDASGKERLIEQSAFAGLAQQFPLTYFSLCHQQDKKSTTFLMPVLIVESETGKLFLPDQHLADLMNALLKVSMTFKGNFNLVNPLVIYTSRWKSEGMNSHKYSRLY